MVIEKCTHQKWKGITLFSKAGKYHITRLKMFYKVYFSQATCILAKCEAYVLIIQLQIYSYFTLICLTKECNLLFPDDSDTSPVLCGDVAFVHLCNYFVCFALMCNVICSRDF